jgi:hypothetical protein
MPVTEEQGEEVGMENRGVTKGGPAPGQGTANKGGTTRRKRRRKIGERNADTYVT